MGERRGMGQALALTPEKMAFIQGGTNVAAPSAASPGNGDAAVKTGQSIEEPTSESQPATADEVAPSPTSARRQRPTAAARSTSNVSAEQDGIYGHLLVPLTTRLQPTTADALRRACLEQKLARKAPHSQQDIVELAVNQWLREHRFL